MRDEHFGIVVVEMMASGAVPIAHDSAGPEMDIIGCFNPAPGFLASNETEYADMSHMHFQHQTSIVKQRRASPIFFTVFQDNGDSISVLSFLDPFIFYYS